MLAAIALLGPLIQPGEAAKPLSRPGDHEFRIEHQGRSRTYKVHLPRDFQPGKPRPLVIVLHGGAGNADNAIRMTGMNKKSDEAGFIAAYPNGTGLFKTRVLTWNAANCCGRAKKKNVDDVGFIRKMLEKLEKDYAIDPRRVYVTGMSNGGMLAFRLACEMADKIAAIAPVAAAFNDDPCQPAEPVSVIMFNGTLDKRVPFDGGTGPEATEDRIDRSVSEAISFWIDVDACDPMSEIHYSKDNTVQWEIFSSSKNGTAVVLYTIKGGGHAWPGGRRGYIFADIPTKAISATDIMWDFFVKHPKPRR